MNSNSDIRWKQRFFNYKKALNQLSRACDIAIERPLTELEQQGLIQAFEFTHELAWKTIKDFLNYKGNQEIYGSKDATKQAFSYGIISNGEIWMDMIQSRNNTSHTYNEETAVEIKTLVLEQYLERFKELEKKLESLL